jgi:hypothetical protein
MEDKLDTLIREVAQIRESQVKLRAENIELRAEIAEIKSRPNEPSAQGKGAFICCGRASDVTTDAHEDARGIPGATTHPSRTGPQKPLPQFKPKTQQYDQVNGNGDKL